MSGDRPAEVSDPKVVGLQGKPVGFPAGTWEAAVDERGNLVERDGLLVRVR